MLFAPLTAVCWPSRSWASALACWAALAIAAGGELLVWSDQEGVVGAQGELVCRHLAAVFHVSVGHGVGCLMDGGAITVLTSIWFRRRGRESDCCGRTHCPDGAPMM
jgi:hypothetical protein